MAVASRFISIDNSIAPTRDAVPGSGGGESGAVRPSVSTVVLMNMSDVSRTSFLARASLRKTTFQPSFLLSSEYNTCVA
jgi:hypothetical protein